MRRDGPERARELRSTVLVQPVRRPRADAGGRAAAEGHVGGGGAKRAGRRRGRHGLLPAGAGGRANRRGRR